MPAQSTLSQRTCFIVTILCCKECMTTCLLDFKVLDNTHVVFTVWRECMCLLVLPYGVALLLLSFQGCRSCVRIRSSASDSTLSLCKHDEVPQPPSLCFLAVCIRNSVPLIPPLGNGHTSAFLLRTLLGMMPTAVNADTLGPSS